MSEQGWQARLGSLLSGLGSPEWELGSAAKAWCGVQEDCHGIRPCECRLLLGWSDGPETANCTVGCPFLKKYCRLLSQITKDQ